MPKLALVIALLVTAAITPVSARGAPPRTFRVWVFADAHVGTDKAHGRESLATALRQSESVPDLEWDIALDLGDLSGAQGTPQDEEGQEIVRQFSVLGGIVASRSTIYPATTTAAALTSRRRGGGESGSTPRASTRNFRRGRNQEALSG